MKKLTGILCLVLAVIMCAATLASCGETGKADTTTAPAAQTTEEVGENTTAGETEPVFPEHNYEGSDFTVYARVNSTYSASYIYAEEENGDVMNDSTVKRNTRLKERYNINIVQIDAKTPYSTVKNDIAGGQVTYDVILDRRNELANLVTQGCLMNVNNLNIDMSNSWWDANCAEDYSVNGKLYFFVNDVSTANLTSARFLYFNKQIVEDYKLDDPYTLIENNQWTLDKFLNMVKSVSNIAADGTMGTYGLLLETGSNNGNYMHLLFGCGVTLTKKSDDGITENITDNATKIDDIFSQLSVVLNDSNCVLSYSDASKLDTTGGTYGNIYDQGRANFAAGHFLFVQNGMGVSSAFTEMEDEFGIALNPKYNTDQEEYYHKVDKYSIIWAVPEAASIDTEKVADVMDLWAYLSTDTVMSSFYDLTVKLKRVSEGTASAMLDIVKSTIVYEMADIYDFQIISAVEKAWGGASISSALKTYKKAIDKKVNAFNDDMAG